MNRGSKQPSTATRGRTMPGFNEAPIHESGKFDPGDEVRNRALSLQ